MPKLMLFFEICAEVLVPKFIRAEVRLPASRTAGLNGIDENRP